MESSESLVGEGNVCCSEHEGKGRFSQRRSSSDLRYLGIGAFTSSQSLGVEAGHQEEMTVIHLRRLDHR